MVRIRLPSSSPTKRRGHKYRFSRCVKRVAIVLWFAGLTACVWFMAGQYIQALRQITNQQTTQGQVRREKGNVQNQQNVMKERLKQQSTVRSNQNWMQRTFVRPNQHQQEGSEESQQQQKSWGVQLPHWLKNGRQDVAVRQSSQHQNSDEGNTDGTDSTAKYGKYHVSKRWAREHPECIGINPTFLKPTHGCEVNQDTFAIHCHFENFRVDVDKIQMKAKGGEPIQSVMGRDERDEFPTYRPGAFITKTKPSKPKINQKENDREGLHYLEPLLMALKYPTKKNPTVDFSCTETWHGTTLFVTRYEYANLYHTMTDWWNAYFSSGLNDATNDGVKDLRVVFLDGHAQGNLDPIWGKLFGQNQDVQYISQLPSGGVCCDNAILIPPGYSSALFPQYFKPRCPIPAMANEFVSHVLTSYNLQDVKREVGNILIIDRQPYTAHPRSHPSQTQRVLDNMKQLKQQLAKRRLPKVTSIEVVQLEKLPFEEQVRKIRQAHVLIGNHGAGLTHVMFLQPRSHVIELTQEFTLDFFEYMTEWRPGVEHTYMSIEEADRMSQSTIDMIVSQVESIMLLPDNV